MVIDLAKEETIPQPGTVLDFSSWTGSGPAVIVTCTAPTFADNRRRPLRGLRVLGPGRKFTNTTGVFFCAAAHAAMYDCRIHDWGSGVVFGDDVWGLTLTNVNIHGCHVCINYPKARNSGEVLAFHGGCLFNSATAVRTSYGPSLQFFGTAFDYCYEKTFVIEGGAEIGLYGCHIETGHIWQKDNPVVEIGPGWNRFIMKGGTIWMSKKTWAGEYFDEVGPWLKNQGDLVLLDSVRIHNMRGEYFQEGEGKLTTHDLTVYNSDLPLFKRRWWFPWGPKLGQDSFLASVL
jgi:hypothetical protein